MTCQVEQENIDLKKTIAELREEIKDLKQQIRDDKVAASPECPS